MIVKFDADLLAEVIIDSVPVEKLGTASDCLHQASEQLDAVVKLLKAHGQTMAALSDLSGDLLLASDDIDARRIPLAEQS